MASIRKLRNKWYARIRLWDISKGINSEMSIPLRTTSKTTALVRLAEVNRKEKDIKTSYKFSFAWLNDEGKTKIIRLSLAEAVNQYKQDRLLNGIKESTIERFNYAIKSFYRIVKKDYPLQSISSKHFDFFKEYYQSINKPNTININLSKLRAFFNWCYSKDLLKNIISIGMIKTPEKPIVYISDNEFKNILDVVNIDNHFKRAFLFYRETGCRKAEPFYGQLDGNWLILHPELTKTGRTREIELTNVLVNILKEMQSRFRTLPYLSKSIIDRYSKEFKKACCEIGLNHNLHNLRDTYAVRLWALTGDIHYVSKVIGHTSVTMTEKYANFNIRRLINDFPTIKKYIKKRLNLPKMGIVETQNVDTKLLKTSFINGVFNA